MLGGKLFGFRAFVIKLQETAEEFRRAEGLTV